MATLVFLEHHEGELQKGSLGALSKAAELAGGDVAAVLVGSGIADLAAEAGKYGALSVFVADDSALEKPLPQPRVDALAQLVREQGFDTVVFAWTPASTGTWLIWCARTASSWASGLHSGTRWSRMSAGRPSRDSR
jgi:electron transfer flavoprotein alpha subunit